MSLVQVSDGIVLDRDEVLACVVGSAFRQIDKGQSQEQTCLLVTFRGREHQMPFYCGDPEDAIKKLTNGQTERSL